VAVASWDDRSEKWSVGSVEVRDHGIDERGQIVCLIFGVGVGCCFSQTVV
jgi:hypothetical protein